MVAVFTSFALNYPRKIKQRGYLVENDGITDIHTIPQPWDFHNSHIGEIIIGDKLIAVQESQVSGQHIFDVYQNDMLNGEEIIAIKSTLPEGQVGALWSPCIPVIKRMLELDNILGQQVERDVVEMDIINCQLLFPSYFPWGYKVTGMGIYDFGYDVGSRWYLVITSIYGDPIESYAWDLGSEINRFDPKYGWLAYKHEHTDGIEIETYTQIVDFDYPEYPCPNLLYFKRR